MERELVVRPSGRVTYITVALLAAMATWVISQLASYLGPYLPVNPMYALYFIWGIAFIAAFSAFVRVKVQRIDVSGKGIASKTGLLNIKKIFIPYWKVDNVRINRSFVQRLFLLGELSIDTAGTSQLEIKMNDIPSKYLDSLVETIHAKMEEKRPEGEHWET